MSFEYNRVGLKTLDRDGNGNATQLQYDAFGRLARVTDAMGHITEYRYDLNGNRTDVWDAEHTSAAGFQSTQVMYDALNRPVSVRDPLGNTVTQAYDEWGNLVSTTEPRPQGSLTVTYGYDLGHRLVSVTYPNLTGKGPVSPVEYVYDGGGRRLLRRDETGAVRYTYDVMGRLAQVVGPQEVSFVGYDAVGNTTSVGYSLGTVGYTYDAANRMTKVTDPLGNVTTYEYDLYGHVKTVTLPGGMKRTFTYHTLPNGAMTNRLQTLANGSSNGGTSYWTGTYKYDYTGNVRNIDVSWNQSPSTFSLTATYDSLYRITQWKDTSISDSGLQTYYYTYDAAGNRLESGNKNVAGQVTYITPKGNEVIQRTEYNAANRPTRQYTAMRDNYQQLTPGDSTENLTYESNGNSRQELYWYAGSTSSRDGIADYDFDDANRLVFYDGELLDPSVGWLQQEWYSYDGDGRRVDWTANLCAPWPVQCDGQTVVHSYKQYEYVGEDVVSERSANGDVPVWYVYGQGGEKLYTLHWDNTALTADVYAKDHLGSVRQVVKPNGQTANSYHYDAFGLPRVATVTVANSFQFASAPLDAVYRSPSDGYTSFYNLQARLYNPRSGRFLTQDTEKPPDSCREVSMACPHTCLV